MKGYYKMPEATAAAIDEDGWLHTGDLARRDTNGYFKITGRIRDMIIREEKTSTPRKSKISSIPTPRSVMCR